MNDLTHNNCRRCCCCFVLFFFLTLLRDITISLLLLLLLILNFIFLLLDVMIIVKPASHSCSEAPTKKDTSALHCGFDHDRPGPWSCTSVGAPQLSPGVHHHRTIGSPPHVADISSHPDI